MTNINPDNLKKGEPYVVYAKNGFLYLNFYSHRQGEELVFINNFVYGTSQKQEFTIDIDKIDVITPLQMKRGCRYCGKDSLSLEKGGKGN